MRALFVFCEGEHDVAFLARILSIRNGFTLKYDALKDYPHPLDQYFPKILRRYPFRDYRADEFGPLPMLPRAAVADEDKSRAVFLFSANGKHQYKKVKKKIEELTEILKPKNRQPLDIDSYSFAFIFDADDDLEKSFRESFREFEKGYLEVLPAVKDLSPNGWISPVGDERQLEQVGCYYFTSGESAGKTTGTLEQGIGPLAREQDPERYANFNNLFSSEFQGDVLKESKRIKSNLTSLGQRFHPGCSLAVALRGGKIVPDASIKESPFCARIAKFFSLWMNQP